MDWQQKQDQDPGISVEDVFQITLDVEPETTFEGDLEYVEDPWGGRLSHFPTTFTDTSSAVTTLYSWWSYGIRTLCWGKNWTYFT